MKIKFPLILLILFGTITNAQVTLDSDMRRETIDTIYINNNTSYLLFNHDIYSFGISNINDFVGLAYENNLQIRAKTLVPGTIASVFITYGDSTYKQYKYCYLYYDPYRMNEYYDYRDDFNKYKKSRVQQKHQLNKNKEEEENFFIAELKTRANNILNMPDELDFGKTENNLSLLCRLIRIDKEYGYVKLEFINNSSIDYNFEKVSFQYEEKYRQGFLKRKKVKHIDVWPVITPEYLRINAYEKKAICYVIPIYGLENKENMLITFREKLGGRNISIQIPSEEISTSKLLF